LPASSNNDITITDTNDDTTQTQIWRPSEKKQQPFDVHAYLQQLTEEIDGVEGEIESVKETHTNCQAIQTTPQQQQRIEKFNYNQHLQKLNKELDGVETRIKSSWEVPQDRIVTSNHHQTGDDDNGANDRMVHLSSKPRTPSVDYISQRNETITSMMMMGGNGMHSMQSITDQFVKHAVLQWDAALQSMNPKSRGGGGVPVMVQGSNLTYMVESEILNIIHETVNDDVGGDLTHSIHTTENHPHQLEKKQTSVTTTQHETEIVSLLKMFQNHHQDDRPHNMQNGVAVVVKEDELKVRHENHQLEVAQMLAASAYKEEMHRQDKLQERKLMGYDRARELQDRLDHDVDKMEKLHATRITTRQRRVVVAVESKEGGGGGSSIPEQVVVANHRGISRQNLQHETDGRCPPPSGEHTVSKSLLQKTAHLVVRKTKSLVHVADHGTGLFIKGNVLQFNEGLGIKGNIHQRNKVFHRPSSAKVSHIRTPPQKELKLMLLLRRKNEKSKLMARTYDGNDPCNIVVEHRGKEQLNLRKKPGMVETSLPLWSLLTKRKIIIPALMIAVGRGAIKAVFCILI